MSVSRLALTLVANFRSVSAVAVCWKGAHETGFAAHCLEGDLAIAASRCASGCRPTRGSATRCGTARGGTASRRTARGSAARCGTARCRCGRGRAEEPVDHHCTAQNSRTGWPQ